MSVNWQPPTLQHFKSTMLTVKHSSCFRIVKGAMEMQGIIPLSFKVCHKLDGLNGLPLQESLNFNCAGRTKEF